MADDLPIIDAHHHLWDLEKHRYPWLAPDRGPPGMAGDVTPIARTYTVDDYLADYAGQKLVKSVHVEGGFDPADPVAETRWLQAIADERGFPHAIVAHARPHEPDFQAVLEGHKQFANVRGIRHMINWHEDMKKTYSGENYLKNERWLAGYGLMARYDLSFDLQLYAPQMEDAARLIERNPGIPVVVDHSGMPVDREPELIELWRKGMKRLAGIPHVCVKISGLGMCDWRWTVESIRPFVLYLIETFGTDRAMFGSNFPVDKLYSSPAALWNAFKEITADLSRDERTKLFSGNAARFYRI